MIEQVQQIIRQGRSFVLVTHINPDGDGVGSQAALWRFLHSLGKEAWIVLDGPLPRNLAFLEPGGSIRVFDPGRDGELVRRADAIFVLDNSAPERLGRLREPIVSSPAIKVCIDHHPDPDPLWQVQLIRETACATGEVVYDLIRAMEGEVTPEMATALYTAVVTDTGHFRFSNTTAATHRLAGKLMEHGVAADRVHQELFEQTSPAFARLLGASLASLEIEAEGSMGVFRITRELVRQCGAEGEDTSEIINAVLGIAGIRLAVLLKELPDGRTKVSFRSKGTLDVNRLARRFGGGGHRNASGVVLDEAMADAEPRVLEESMALVTGGGSTTGETGASLVRP